MILDSLEQSGRYEPLHASFARAFDFLRSVDLPKLPEGRNEIDGDRIFALVSRSTGRGRREAKLEAHRKYIDIQFIAEGTDTMGWRDLKSCASPEASFDVANDYIFYKDEPETWFEVAEGQFALFFPDDAHAPLAGDTSVTKVVVKVAV